MRVREFMTSPAVSLARTATVREAAALMVRKRINSLVVTGVGGEPAVVGLLTASEVELAETVVPFTVPSARPACWTSGRRPPSSWMRPSPTSHGEPSAM